MPLTPKMAADGDEAIEHFVVEAVNLIVKIVMSVGGPFVLDDDFYLLASSSGFRRFPIHHLDSRFH